MISVASRSVTGDFSVDARAAIGCVLQLFENVHPRSFTEDHTGPISRERPRCAMRLIVPVVGQYGHEVETGKNTRRDWRINPARNHHVLSTKGDVLRGISHCITGARATGRDDVR